MPPYCWLSQAGDDEFGAVRSLTPPAGDEAWCAHGCSKPQAVASFHASRPQLHIPECLWCLYRAHNLAPVHSCQIRHDRRHACVHNFWNLQQLRAAAKARLRLLSCPPVPSSPQPTHAPRLNISPTVPLPDDSAYRDVGLQTQLQKVRHPHTQSTRDLSIQISWFDCRDPTLVLPMWRMQHLTSLNADPHARGPRRLPYHIKPAQGNFMRHLEIEKLASFIDHCNAPPC